MDPTVTLARLLEALQHNDRDETVECLNDLTAWIEGCGFLPSPLEDKNPTFISRGKGA